MQDAHGKNGRCRQFSTSVQVEVVELSVWARVGFGWRARETVTAFASMAVKQPLRVFRSTLHAIARD